MGFAKLSQLFETNHTVMVWFAPRGVGLSAWSTKPRDQVQIRRRFMLLGQTVDGMRVWDILQATHAVRSIESMQALQMTLQGEGEMGVNVLYASLFTSGIDRLEFADLPNSHHVGPDYLNVLRFLDIPEALAMAAEKSSVKLIAQRTDDWKYPLEVHKRLGWATDRLQIAPE